MKVNKEEVKFLGAIMYISLLIIAVYFFYITLMLVLPIYKEKKMKRSQKLFFIFLIPCLNEERVIERTITNLLKLNYQNMLIIPIDDASDDRTVERIKKIKDKRVRLLKRTKPNAQQGKGAALNDAYKRVLKKAKSLNMIDQIIIGIVDGDGKLGKNVIKEANAAFLKKSVCAAQCRVRIINTNKLLPFLQDVEFFTMISDIQNIRSYIKSVGLGGNGQFTRLRAMIPLGKNPWGNSLLEDYDMTLRLLLLGGEIKYLPNAAVYQQGLSSLKKLIYQRSRWVQGNIQCLKYLKRIENSKKIKRDAKVDIYFFLAQPLMNLIGSLVFFASWVRILYFLISLSRDCLKGDASWLEVVLCVIVLIILTSIPGFIFTIRHFFNTRRVSEQKGNSFFQCLLAGLAMTGYNVIMIPSVWIAYKRYLLGENSWLKTERETEN